MGTFCDRDEPKFFQMFLFLIAQTKKNHPKDPVIPLLHQDNMCHASCMSTRHADSAMRSENLLYQPTSPQSQALPMRNRPKSQALQPDSHTVTL